MRRLAIPAAMLSTAAFFTFIASCDSEDKTTYEAVVAWDIGGVRSCNSSPLSDDPSDTLNFETIEITVWKDEKDIGNEKKKPVFDGLTTPCTNGEYTIDNIDRGKYYVVLEAIATHDGIELPYFAGAGEITVPSDEMTLITLRLNNGSLTAGWDFETGMCGTNDVEKVEVKLKYKKGSKTLLSGKVPCNDGKYRFEGLEWDYYAIEAEGYNAAGKLTHRGVYEAEAADIPDEGDGGTDTSGDYANSIEVRPGMDIGIEDATVVLQKI